MILITLAAVFAGSFLLGSGIALIIGLVLFIWGLKTLRESQVVAKIPESPVGSIAPGPAHVHGKTTGDDVLLSPITGVPCYYYRAQVEKLVKQGGQPRWEIFKNETALRNFYVEDGSGRVLVDLQGVEFELPQTLQAEIGPDSNHSCFIERSLGLPRPNENQLHAVLLADWQHARAAVQAMGIPGGKAVDKVLGAGEKMARWGIAMNIDGVEINPGGVGESYRLRETCLLAGHEYSVVGTCDQNPNATDPRNAKVISKGASQKTFLVSPKTGAQLAGGLHLRGIIFMVVGIAIMVGGIVIAVLRPGER